MRQDGAPARRIAEQLGMERSTLYRELGRGYCGDDENGEPMYSAAVAQNDEQKRMARRGRKNKYAERRAASDAGL